MRYSVAIVFLFLYVFQVACTSMARTGDTGLPAIKPVIVTDTVRYDSDDPAIWINRDNPAASLILGTDKDQDGALYVFDLQGKVQHDKVVRNLQRPNNVDIEYGLSLNGKPTDIAVVTERFTHKLRVFSLPDCKPVDGDGLPVFEGETGTEFRDLMGIALYKNKAGKVYAIVGRKTGPREGGYLWQYLLEDDGQGRVKATLVRKFGQFSGIKEIEAIAVDDVLGYVYYSDEGYGVRKYYADPEKGNEELTVFGRKGFKQDHEGISIYATSDSTGYLIVSDQQTNHFQLFTREGVPGNPHEHRFIKKVHLSTLESDGSEVVALPLNGVFTKGLFVAMSTDKTFHFYRWEDLMP
ncbi:phytase [Paraflavitalea sp. CAU 1676]|uniref:phytase n=1 Tax=Paraflavitalea sp. CAU 1676 TaxID=3032598 RepID=UPI0023D9EA26|nr:phytase [Paraflavitalea sp. CAU 1676]MDF2187606.1 phytase [Paraflavitalea sp. CAU 1676]